MSEIIIEEIVDPEIKKQKPPETISKDGLFEDAIEKAAEDPRIHNDKGLKNEIRLLNFIIYFIIVILIIVLFLIIKS